MTSLTETHFPDQARARRVTGDIAAAEYACVVERVRLGGPGVEVIVVGGEIDGCGADQLGGYVYRVTPRGTTPILGITDIGFLGVEGLRAVMALTNECRRFTQASAVVAAQSVIGRLRTITGATSSR